MSQLNTPMRRASGELDVYSGLLFAAAVVLLGGIIWLALANIEHSKSTTNDDGGPFKLVEPGR
ncbi:MAG: hypothetical protein SGJ09_11430 [Phycisphaerae bacterium]|nr:hypothetical protein [Phycisphaerae bacterium]